MNGLKLSPVFISALLLAAHFYRSELYPLVIMSLSFPALLLFKIKWADITVQILLILGGLEWIRTTYYFALERQAEGMPYTRMVIILGLVALFTACSALVFRYKSLKDTRYKTQDSRH